MKKGRPGIQLWCMCRREDEKEMENLLFTHTTTWGLRVYEPRRVTLERELVTVETEYGPVRAKRSVGELRKEKPEYEDMAKLARERNVSIAEIAKAVSRVSK